MSNTTYVRWHCDDPRPQRTFPPLHPDHPAAHIPCAHCEFPLGDGHDVQLLAIGPYDTETREDHREGRYYPARAILLHARCVQQLVDTDQVEQFIAELEPLERP